MQMDDDAAWDAIWALEERFWTGGEDHYRSALDPACVMAFPAPAGVMSGPSIAASLAQAPRWSSVVMSGRHVARPAPGLIVLGYRAQGQRDGAALYEAFCTSTYRSRRRRVEACAAPADSDPLMPWNARPERVFYPVGRALRR